MIKQTVSFQVPEDATPETLKAIGEIVEFASAKLRGVQVSAKFLYHYIEWPD